MENNQEIISPNDYEAALIQLLRISVGSSAELPPHVDWPQVWNLACRHHLEAMIAEAAEACPDVPEELRAQMKAAVYQMIARTARQEYWLARLEEQLKAAGIPYGIMKGGILRNDYSKAYYRFMSDLDIYVRQEDRGAIRSAVESIGGVYKNSDSGDDAYILDGTVGVEFHGRLVYRNIKGTIVSYPDWPCVDESRNRLTEEGYVLNMIGHAVGDLVDAGLGVRYVLDLWIYKNRHEPQPDWNAVERRLRDDGIDKLASNLFQLGEFLFGDGEATPLMEEMAQYVLEGGLYGASGRSSASAAAKAGGRLTAVKKQVFRSREEFVNRYPWLKSYPFLLPLAWGMRLGRSFRLHRKYIGRWLRGVCSVSDREVSQQKERLTRFGL